jgi:hypothetical protein
MSYTLSQNIRAISFNKGIWITDLCELLNCNPIHIKNIYSGKKEFSINELCLLSQKLNITFVINNGQINIKSNK